MTPRNETGGEKDPWLDDPDAPPTEEELRAIAALEGSLSADEAELAEAVQSAHSPKPIDQLSHERILRRTVLPRSVRRSPRVVVLAVAGSALLAAAAAMIVVGSMKRGEAPALSTTAQLSLIPCRSSQDLFDQPFPREGGESARIDRIAQSREHDLRQNRFSSWGVQ